MPRRRLSERQIARIRTIQARRRQRLAERGEQVFAELDEAEPVSGCVIVRHGANLAIEDDDGRVWSCLARQNIGDPVCGDRVVWQPIGDGKGIVTALQARHTLLSRPDHAGRDRPLAANIDQLVVVIAPRPEPSVYLLDQYLVAAELLSIAARIAVTKMDLLDAVGKQTLQRRLAHYEALGYPLLWLSLREGETPTGLTESLRGHTSILVGQSGVGKSSLVKALLPDREVQIGRLSRATGLGRHTTSATTRYRLGERSFLIDSPGVRSFRLGAIGGPELAQGYREIAPLVGHCRFADCRHDQEPDCALKRAAEAGRVHPERLATFRHLLRACVV